jgi:hypothetical protein
MSTLRPLRAKYRGPGRAPTDAPKVSLGATRQMQYEERRKLLDKKVAGLDQSLSEKAFGDPPATRIE